MALGNTTGLDDIPEFGEGVTVGAPPTTVTAFDDIPEFGEDVKIEIPEAAPIEIPKVAAVEKEAFDPSQFTEKPADVNADLDLQYKKEKPIIDPYDVVAQEKYKAEGAAYYDKLKGEVVALENKVNRVTDDYENIDWEKYSSQMEVDKAMGAKREQDEFALEAKKKEFAKAKRLHDGVLSKESIVEAENKAENMPRGEDDALDARTGQPAIVQQRVDPKEVELNFMSKTNPTQALVLRDKIAQGKATELDLSKLEAQGLSRMINVNANELQIEAEEKKPLIEEAELINSNLKKYQEQIHPLDEQQKADYDANLAIYKKGIADTEPLRKEIGAFEQIAKANDGLTEQQLADYQELFSKYEEATASLKPAIEKLQYYDKAQGGLTPEQQADFDAQRARLEEIAPQLTPLSERYKKIQHLQGELATGDMSKKALAIADAQTKRAQAVDDWYKEQNWFDQARYNSRNVVEGTLARFASSIISLPRTIASHANNLPLIGGIGYKYDATDALADFATSMTEYMDGFAPSNLGQEFAQDYAMINGLKVVVKNGEVESVRDADGFLVRDPFAIAAATQEYEDKKPTLKTEQNIGAGAYHAANAIMDMGVTLLPIGGLVGKWAKGLGAADKLADAAGIYAGSFILIHKTAYEDGLAAGLSPELAGFYAHGMAAIETATETLNPLEMKLIRKMRGGSSASRLGAEEFARRYMMGASKTSALTYGLGQVVKNMGMEGLEEMGARYFGDKLDGSLNVLAASDFDIKSTTNEYLGDFVVGAATGLAFSPIVIAGSRSDLERQTLSMLVESPDDAIKYIDALVGKTVLNNKGEKLVFTQEQADAVKLDMKNLTERVNSIKDISTLDEEKKITVTALVQSKMALERELAKPNLDDIAKKKYKTLIESANKQLELLAAWKAGDSYITVNNEVISEADFKTKMTPEFIKQVAFGSASVIIGDNPVLQEEFRKQYDEARKGFAYVAGENDNVDKNHSFYTEQIKAAKNPLVRKYLQRQLKQIEDSPIAYYENKLASLEPNKVALSDYYKGIIADLRAKKGIPLTAAQVAAQATTKAEADKRAAELKTYANERQVITDIYEEDWDGYTDEQQDKFRAERERIFKEDKKLFDAHATPEQKAELKKLTKKGFLELFYTKDKKRRTDWERHGTETSYISDVVDDILGVKKAETATPATTNNTTTTNSNTAITPDDIKVSITGSNGGFGLKAGDQIDEKDIRHVFDDSAIQESVTSGEPLQVTESKAGGKRVIRVIHGTVDHVGRTGVSIINVELPENSSLTKEQVAELASEKIKEKTTDNKQHEFYGSAAEVRSVYDQIIAEIKQKGTETTKTENNVSQQGTKGVGTNPAGNKTVGKKDGSEVVKGDGKEAPAEKSEKEKIEDRRKKELGDWGLDKVLNEGDYVPDDYSGKLKLQKEINDKYDAELAALEKPKTNEKTDETASKTDTTNQEGTTTQTGEPSKTQTSPVNDASETKDADTRKAKEEEIADDANALFGVDVKFNPDGTYEITGEGDIEGARTFVDEATKEIKKPEPKGTLEEQHEAIVKRQGEIFEKAKTDAAARAEYNSLNKKKQAIERQLFQEKKKNRFKEGSAKYIEFERVMEEFHNNSRPLLRKVFDFIEEFGTLTFEGNRWLDLIGTAFGDVEAMKPILTLVRQLAAQLSYTNEGSSAMIDRMVQSEYWKKALKGVYRSKDINAAKMKKRLGSAVMNGIKGYSGYTEALHNDYKKYKEYQKKGYLKGIPKSDEAPVKEEPKAPLSEARQFGVDFANAGLVETREIGGRGNEHQRLDLRMSNDEKIRAVKDIKEGNYETTAAKMMLDRIEQMYNEGALGYVMGSGGSTQQAGAVLIEDAKKHIEDIKQGKEEAPKEEAPKPTENEPFHNATAESIPEEIHTAIVDRIKNALSQAFGTAVHIVKDAKELMKAANKQPLFHTKDGNPIGFTYDTDQVARERFDLSKLKQIGKGSDRTVFDLGNGKVLKIAHTARGLAQNIYEGDGYLAGDVIPEVHERGLNYVVTDNAPRLKAADIVPVYDWNSGEEVGTERAGDMMKELAKFSQIDFDEHNADLEAVLAKYGFTDIFSYDVMYNDFAAMRNWGFKDGKPLHIDGGTFGGVQRILNAYRGKTSMQDADFRAIYNKSRAVKKGNKETDKFTKFQDEKGVPLGFADRNGDIWLNGEKINGNTPIHEAGHLWQRWAAEHAPNLLKAGLDKISRSPYLAQVRNNKFYIDQADKQGLKGKEREDFFRNEALAMAIGDKGEQFVSEAKKADFKAWLAELWKAVAEFAGLSEKTAAQIENMTLDEFAKAVAADLLSGKPLKGKVEGKEGGEFAIIGDKGIKGLEQAEKYVADLGIARDMESAGESAKDIRWATGWEKGVDGKWRYEIPDVEINGEVNKLPTDRTQQFDKIYTYKKVKLSDIITDDKGLFKAYPEAKDIEVVLYDFSHPDGTSGTYREGNKWMPEDTITLWDVNYESGLSERQKGTLLHEIQHHIQHKEGFAVGASPSGISQADIPLNPKFAEYNTPENKKRAEEYQRLRNSPEYAQELFESNELFTKEYAPRIDALNEQMIRGDRAQNNAISAQVQEIFDEYSELQKEKFPTMTAADEIAKRTIVRAPDKNISRFDAYLRVAGEVEARNVQARMNMTPDERRATLLSETEKIARNEQIILRESAGVSDSSKDKNQLDLFNDSTEEPKSETGVTANKDTRVSTEKQKPFKFTKITDIPFVGRRGRVDAGNGYEISALATDDGDGGVMYNLAVIKDGELVSSDLYDAKYNDKIPSNPVGFSMGGTMENLTEEEAVAEINKKLSEIADHNAATSTKLPEKKTEKAKSVRPTKEEERLADIKRIERERDHTLYKIEDFEDEINNVKSDLKETIEGIRKEIAEVRAAKMSKSAREEKLEDLKYDIENAKDEAESLISAYKDDIAMEKGDLRRYARQLAKLGQAIPSYSNFSHRASDAVQKLIKQGAKTKDILKQVVSEGGEYSELAQAILTYGDAAGLEVPIRKHSGDFAGQYYPHLDKIDIDKGSVNDLATILHEIIHGMTSKKIPQSLGSGLSTGADYLKVLNEYIANGSNPAVKELAKTYLEAVKQSGHWDALFKGTSKGNTIRSKIYWTGSIGNPRAFARFWFDTPREANKAIAMFKKLGVERVFPRQNRTIIEIRAEDLEKLKTAGIKIDSPKDRAPLTKENTTLHKRDGINGQEYVHELVSENKREFAYPHETLGKTDSEIHDLLIEKANKGNYDNGTIELSTISKTGALANKTNAVADSVIPYGFANLDEFLAEGFTNPKFQEILNTMKMPSGNKSLWQAFVDAVSKIMGLVGKSVNKGSILEKFIKEGANLINQERREPARATTAAELENTGTEAIIANLDNLSFVEKIKLSIFLHDKVARSKSKNAGYYKIETANRKNLLDIFEGRKTDAESIKQAKIDLNSTRALYRKWQASGKDTAWSSKWLAVYDALYEALEKGEYVEQKGQLTLFKRNAQAAAAKIREGKLHKKGQLSAASPMSLAIDAAIEAVALTTELTGALAELLDMALIELRNSDAYKSRKSQLARDTAEAQLKAKLKERISNAKATARAEEPKEKKHKLPVRVIASPHVPDDIKQGVLDKGITYVEETRAMTDAAAKGLMDAYAAQGDLDAVLDYVANPSNKIDMPIRVALEQAIYVSFAEKAVEATRNGDLEEAETNRRKAVDVLHLAQKTGLEAGRAVNKQKDWARLTDADPEALVFDVQSQFDEKNKPVLEKHNETIKTAQEKLRELLESEEGKALFKAKVEEKVAAEQNRPVRKSHIDKAMDALDKAHIKLRSMNFVDLSGVTVAMVDGAFAAAKVTLRTTQSVLEAVETAVKYVKEELAKAGINDWAKEDAFRQAVEESLTADGIRVPKKKTPKQQKVQQKKDVAQGLRDQLDSLDALIKDPVKALEALEAKKKKAEERVAANESKSEEIKALENEIAVRKKLLSLVQGMEGITDAQKKEILSEALDSIIKNGYLSEPAFRQMFAKALGLETLTAKDEQIIRKGAAVIQNVSAAQRRYLADPTPENLKAYRKAVREGRLANEVVSRYFRERSTLGGLFSTFIRGNLLSTTTVVLSGVSNVATSPVRWANNAIASSIDFLRYQLSRVAWLSRNVKYLENKRFNDFFGNQREYYAGLPEGLKEGILQLWSGSIPDEVFEREMKGGLHPLEALMRVYNHVGQKEKQKIMESLVDGMEATLGVAPELIFRLLNVTDKPFRTASSKAALGELVKLELAHLKKELLKKPTLTQQEAELLRDIRSGKEYQRRMIEPSEAISEKAGEEGSAGVFQNKSMLLAAIEGASKAIAAEHKKRYGESTEKPSLLWATLKGLGKIASAATFPFINMPANWVEQTILYTNPLIALGLAGVHAKVGNVRKANQLLATAAIGVMLSQAALWIIVNGIARGSAGDDDDDERQKAYARGGYKRINWSLFQRQFTGGSKNWEEGDLTMEFYQMGLTGSVLLSYVDLYKNYREEMAKQNNIAADFFSKGFYKFGSSVTTGLDMPTVQGTNMMLNALSSGDEKAFDKVMIQTANALKAIYLPSTYIKGQKALDKDAFLKNVKDDDWWQQFKNSYKYQMGNGGDLPNKHTSWGEPILKTPSDRNAWVYNLLDITKASKIPESTFGLELYNLHDRLKKENSELANGVLPPVLGKSITINEVTHKLSEAEYETYLQFVGQRRKEIVSRYIENGVNDMMFSTDSDEQRVKNLTDLYAIAAKVGRTQFVEKMGWNVEEEVEDDVLDDIGVTEEDFTEPPPPVIRQRMNYFDTKNL